MAPSPLPMRTLLFVPGDNEAKLAKASAIRADGLILDLEDSVAPQRKQAAREIVARFLRQRSAQARSIWVRVNGPGGEALRADIASITGPGLDGLVLPKARSASDVVTLGELLPEFERRSGMPIGAVRILPIVTETPAAVLRLAEYAQCGPRLAALTWGAEDLSVALGATENTDAQGNWLSPYELARSLCLIAAAAAGVPAIDTVFTRLADMAGLQRSAAAARRDGFAGKLAIHPAQLQPIQLAFTPSPEEADAARRIVAAFEAEDSGVIALDGRMLDLPHLERARRVLQLAALEP